MVSITQALRRARTHACTQQQLLLHAYQQQHAYQQHAYQFMQASSCRFMQHARTTRRLPLMRLCAYGVRTVKNAGSI
jgi:hypothetical protein